MVESNLLPLWPVVNAALIVYVALKWKSAIAKTLLLICGLIGLIGAYFVSFTDEYVTIGECMGYFSKALSVVLLVLYIRSLFTETDDDDGELVDEFKIKPYEVGA